MESFSQCILTTFKAHACSSLHTSQYIKEPTLDYSDWWLLFWLVPSLGNNKGLLCFIEPHPNLPLTASSSTVSSTDHGVLRGPICDIDSWLWSVLPRLDHVGSDLCRAMEVIANIFKELKLQPHDDERFDPSTNKKKRIDLVAFVILFFI